MTITTCPVETIDVTSTQAVEDIKLQIEYLKSYKRIAEIDLKRNKEKQTEINTKAQVLTQKFINNEINETKYMNELKKLKTELDDLIKEADELELKITSYKDAIAALKDSLPTGYDYEDDEEMLIPV